MTSLTFFTLFVFSFLLTAVVSTIIALRERYSDKIERNSISVEAEAEYERFSTPPTTVPSTPKSLEKYPTELRREYIAMMHEEIMKIRDAAAGK